MPKDPLQPTVAIVGRPNVGKSTLFNRLAGRRLALVSDLPGLTRDRRQSTIDLQGVNISLVDTAGLEESASASISSRMRKQTELAINSADLVLFVIDAREGVTPVDATFAKLVRASGTPTILVANKCEGRAGMDRAYEAFELGLGEPVPISAEHGEGIGDLVIGMEAALAIEPAAPEKTDDFDDEHEPSDSAFERGPVRVALVGRPNVGKSTLANGIIGEERSITGPEPGLTRDTIATELTWGDRRIRLFDTAGLRRKTRITETAERLSVGDTLHAIRFAEVVVLVLDAERGLEHQDLTIGELITQEGRTLVIALNKWDLVVNKQQYLKELKETLAERLSQAAGVAIVPVSALGERGLDKLMAAVFGAYEIWNKRVPTSELNRWLQEAIDRHPPPAVHGKRISIRFMTQPSSRPPTFVGFSQRADSLPPAYLRYLVNSLRDAFDMPGTPIRLGLRKRENPFAKKRRR